MSAATIEDIPRRLSDAADDVTRTAIARFVADAGPPPSAFSWVALGSHARAELHCASDQDSGLVWADETSASSAYARDLARSVIDDLAEWGLVRCSGGFTADHWSHDVTGWRALLRRFVWDPEPQAVIDTEVFLDFRPLAGDLRVSDLSSAIYAGAESPRLLHGIAVAATSFPPSLSVFGQLRGDHLHAKKSGLSALVLLARLFALQAGSHAVGTHERLLDAGTAGVLSSDLVDDLIEVHLELTALRLRGQVAAIEAGRQPDNQIDLSGLSGEERRRVQRGLRAVRSAQKAAEFFFRTEL